LLRVLHREDEYEVAFSGDVIALLINTEGDAAPAAYQELVAESGPSVRVRQACWLPGSTR
jgi:hypothetical protein